MLDLREQNSTAMHDGPQRCAVFLEFVEVGVAMPLAELLHKSRQ